MVRKTKKQVYIEDDTAAMPTHGAGSVYNQERKEEARRKRRGYVRKEISAEDLPYAMRLNGKGGKRFGLIFWVEELEIFIILLIQTLSNQ